LFENTIQFLSILSLNTISLLFTIVQVTVYHKVQTNCVQGQNRKKLTSVKKIIFNLYFVKKYWCVKLL